jgi:hypothetical protein
MSQAEKQALTLRDLAVQVVMAKGVLTLKNNNETFGRTEVSTAPDLYSYQDARIRIEYCSGKPHVLDVFKRGDSNLKVLSVVWNAGGDAVVVLHHGGSWEDSLKRVARGGVFSVSLDRRSSSQLADQTV